MHATSELSPVTIHKAATGFSIFSALYTLCTLAMGQSYVFDPYLLSCQLSGLIDPKPLYAIYAILATVIFFSVPVVGIIIANLAILVMAVRARGGIPAKTAGCIPGINALRTVSCVCWAFVISVIPLNVRVLLQVTKVHIPSWYYIAAHELLFMNALVNPIIYTVTNRDIRTFCIKLITRKLAEKLDIRQPMDPGEYISNNVMSWLVIHN